MAKLIGSALAMTTIGVRFWIGLVALLLFAAAGLVRSDASRADEKGAKSKSKPAASAQDDDSSGDGSDLEADECHTALVLPASLLPSSKIIDRMKFSQELRGLLTEGMTGDADSQAAAKKHFDASHRAVPDDPRAMYAYGVALLSHKKTKKALDQFRQAAQQSKAPYLPALQGVVWVYFLKHDYARGIPAALDLARKIEGTKDAWPTDHNRQHTAEWLGKLVGFLTGPGKTSEHAADVETFEADIEKVLTSDRKEAYDHGRKFVTTRHQNLKALVARPTAEIVAELKQKREESQSEAKAADAELKQLEEELRDIKKPHDQQITELKAERRTAGQKSKKAQTEIPDAEEAVDFLSVPRVTQTVRMTGGRYSRPTVSTRTETAAEKKARETQLASAKQKLQQAQAAFDQAKQELSDLKKQIDDAGTDYRKAAAEKLPQLTAAQRKAAELAAHARDINNAAMTPDKLKERVTVLDTYVPLDPETEKTRLLATLKTAG